MKILRSPPCRAFTLIEVLAALLVLALAMTALQVSMAQQLENAAYLRDRTWAGLVATNRMELLRISSRLGNPVPQGEFTGSSEMGGVNWYWVVTPLPGVAGQQQSTILPVVINVSRESPDAARVSPLYSLSGVTDAAWQL
jgi:type II secretion system protein I